MTFNDELVERLRNAMMFINHQFNMKMKEIQKSSKAKAKSLKTFDQVNEIEKYRVILYD